jgi:hypothetical protein
MRRWSAHPGLPEALRRLPAAALVLTALGLAWLTEPPGGRHSVAAETAPVSESREESEGSSPTSSAESFRPFSLPSVREDLRSRRGPAVAHAPVRPGAAASAAVGRGGPSDPARAGRNGFGGPLRC